MEKRPLLAQKFFTDRVIITEKIRGSDRICGPPFCQIAGAPSKGQSMIQYDTENWEISLTGIVNCTTNHSKRIEQKFINYLKPSMNEIAAYESYEKKLQQNKKYSKIYYQKNKVYFLEYMKQYHLRKKHEKLASQSQSLE